MEIAMKPASFEHYAPETLAEAVALLQKLEDDGVDAKILAGGQSLMPMLSLRMARPEALVDLNRIAALKYIREEGDVIAIGAMTSKSAAEDSALIKQKQPLFQRASELIAHRQIRNRGTVGGSFAHADPAAEYGAAAMALGITMKVVGPEGERLLTPDEFYVTFLTTSLGSSDILTELRVPKLAAGTGWSFQELCRRRGDLGICGAAVTLRKVGGKCTDVRIAIFGVNATAARMKEAEKLVEGQLPSPELFVQAGKAAAASVDEPIADVHASGEFRRSLVETFVARGLTEALSRAS